VQWASMSAPSFLPHSAAWSHLQSRGSSIGPGVVPSAGVRGQHGGEWRAACCQPARRSSSCSGPPHLGCG
jgi:hypothetical protein